MLADIASTGFSGAESGQIRMGDTVVVFAQGPIGLCATAGAKLMGASFIIGVEGDPVRIGHVFWTVLHGAIVLQLAGKLAADCDFDTISREAFRALIVGFTPRAQ
jgi:threonine dehydrogenase-like Zn-dependent dehydrogenase